MCTPGASAASSSVSPPDSGGAVNMAFGYFSNFQNASERALVRVDTEAACLEELITDNEELSRFQCFFI